MATITIPEVQISSAHGVSRTMPVIGMGTGSYPPDTETIKLAVLEGIKAGYRHFDTAAIYGSEPGLGQAIAEALHLGLIKSRDELFVTSKLWCDSAQRDLVLPAIKNTLQNLQLEYVDLYLIHWPIWFKQEEVKKYPVPKECIFPVDLKSVWEAMEECQNLGLTKAIGVSNFSSKRLDQLLSFAKIPPAANQVEMNPTWQQKELREFCRAKGIQIIAYSPLGASGTAWGDNRVIGSNILEDIANAKGKTTAQVSLRWLYEQGVSFIPKSFNKERMKSNLEMFDWSLSEEELNRIKHLPQRKGCYLSNMAESHELVSEIDAEI